MTTSWDTSHKLSPSIFGCYWLRNRHGSGGRNQGGIYDWAAAYTLSDWVSSEKRILGLYCIWAAAILSMQTIFLLILSIPDAARIAVRVTNGTTRNSHDSRHKQALLWGRRS
jgi:hypothetical protein